MAGISLKLKNKTDGQQYILSNLDQSTTVRVLKDKITELTQIPAEVLHAVLGYPPYKPLDMTREDELLAAIGIKNVDTLMVSEKQLSEEERLRQANQKRVEEDEKADKELDAQAEGSGGILLKQEVPSDNSCLFTSIGYVMTGKVDPDKSQDMRQIIASTVKADKRVYNEGFLGQPNDDYCDWILRPHSWGGAIEVSILSAYYGIEFDVVDITNTIINRFGEDRNYGMRGFLLFNGTHYDALYLESTSGEKQTTFPVENNNVYMQAEQLAKDAQSSRQFTDVNR